MDRQKAVKNRLLAALPPGDCDRLLHALMVVPLNSGDVLYKPGKRIRFVHFPNGGIITVVVRMKDGSTGEAGMVGTEGMVCPATFLECDSTPFESVVQNPGEALRMTAEDFRAAVQSSEALHRLMHRYVDAFLCMVSQLAACNCLHSLEQRCARWLLMTQDRVGADTFPLTQEFLAQMLGVRRASVTVVAGMLQQAGLITYRRGVITIADRARLEAASCECYRIIRREFERLVGNSRGHLAPAAGEPAAPGA